MDGSRPFSQVCRAVAGNHGMRSRARAQRGPLAMRTRLVQPFAAVLGDPMLRNGYALIVSATVTQVLGVLYWIVAARTAPAAVLGRNSAAIYMMMFLAGVAELNLMSTLVRFLPTSGRRAARFIVSVYAASAAVAAVIA